jgi:hypothetical protein
MGHGKPLDIPGDLLEQMSIDRSSGTSFEISDRDMAEGFLFRVNYEAQLSAISDLLRRNNAEDQRLAAAVNLNAEDAQSQQAVDEWGELFYTSVYQDAAHSMAAVGMIAPLMESLFVQGLNEIGKAYFRDSLPNAKRAIPDPKDFWNCQKYYDRREPIIGNRTKDNVVLGIGQLAGAIDLTPHLPADLMPTLEALFDYRNTMFHNGFEWPEDHCLKFKSRIAEKDWQSRFSCSSRGGEPWIFYMTQQFEDHCLAMSGRIIDASGYCKGRNGSL